MKYIIWGDLHLKNNCIDRLKVLFKEATELNLPLIILGDLLDTKEVIRGACLNAYYCLFKAYKLPIIALVGNHDLFNLDTTEHSLEVLKELPNVTIVDQYYSENNMHFFPYTKDIKGLQDKIAKLKLKSNSTLFLHQGVIGFDYGNGKVADGSGHGELDAKILKKCKVVSGHFHKFAQKGNITFLGTPWTNNFGESNNECRYGIYDSELASFERFIFTNDKFPTHKTFKINLDQGESIPEFNPELDIVRVVLSGSEDKVKDFKKKDYTGVKFIENVTEVSYSGVIDEVLDNETKFIKWANQAELKADLVNKGLEILRGV